MKVLVRVKGRQDFDFENVSSPLQMIGVRLQNRTNIFSLPISMDNISGILQFLYLFFIFVMETKITATVTSLNKVGLTINQSHAEFSRFLVTISLTFTANSYLGAQKASQTRLFQPCFFKQGQTGGKIGSNLDHFDQYLFFGVVSCCYPGPWEGQLIKGFYWSKEQCLFSFTNGGNANKINFAG